MSTTKINVKEYKIIWSKYIPALSLAMNPALVLTDTEFVFSYNLARGQPNPLNDENLVVC